VGVNLRFSHTGSAVCPVKAILPYLRKVCRLLSTFFYLTRQQFKTVLSAMLKQAGLDDIKYNNHSFCISATISAKVAGISNVHILLLHRWQISSYQSFIIPALGKLSKQLVSTSKTALEWNFCRYVGQYLWQAQRLLYGCCMCLS